MRRHLIAALTTVSAIALAGTGLAATAPTRAGGHARNTASPSRARPVCHLITDPAGDPGPSWEKVPGDGSVDITSADIASNATTLTGVVRVASLTNPDPQAPAGQAYFLLFSVKGGNYPFFLSGRTYPTGNAWIFGYQAPDPTTGINTSYTVAQGSGVVDLAKSEVRISVPLSAIRATLRLPAGTVLRSLEALTYRIAGQGLVPSQQVGPVRAPLGGLLLQFDTAYAAPTTVYVAGSPSCVPVGH